MRPIKRILIAVDLADTPESVPRAALNTAHALRDHVGSEVARRLIAEVVPLAQSLDASIEIVYVRETPTHDVAGGRSGIDEVDDWIEQQLGKLAETVIVAGISCITTSLQGSVHRELVAHVTKTSADLVVLGSHGRWHFLESCAERVLLKAHRRILVVPILQIEHGK